MVSEANRLQIEQMRERRHNNTQANTNHFETEAAKPREPLVTRRNLQKSMQRIWSYADH